ncbi:MAG: hypothetical protein RMK74_07065 [Myxococcales bacterium]|nr:hypothetical protein [Myxococcales bacterium]
MIDSGGGTDAAGSDAPTPDTGRTDSGAGGLCPAGECNLLTNAGCPTGQACYFLAESAGMPPRPMCQPAGTGGDGARCTSYMNCREGYTCDTGAGICRHYCCMESDTGCPTGQSCSIVLVDDMGNPLGVGFCKLPDVCDPIAQTGCMGEDACYPTRDGFACARPGTRGEGAACMYVNDCMGRHICAGDPARCMRLCRIGMAGDCGMGQTCVGVMGLEGIGVCNPPRGG